MHLQIKTNFSSHLSTNGSTHTLPRYDIWNADRKDKSNPPLLDQISPPVPNITTRPWMYNSGIMVLNKELTAFNSSFLNAWNTTAYEGWNISNASVPYEGTPIEINLVRAIFVGIILGLMLFMTIGGNVLVLVAVFVNSHLRSTTNYFITNLAIADLLLGTTVLPFSASREITDQWLFGNVFCDIWAAVDVLCCTASIMSLCVISIDRYIGVTRPLQHSTIMSEKRAVYVIISVWVIAMLISIAPLLGWKEPGPNEPGACEVTKQLGYVLFSVSGSFYIPLVIILVVYFRVYKEALTQSRFIATGIKTSKSDDTGKITLRIHTGRASNTHTQKSPYQSSSSSEQSEGSNRKANSRMTLAGKIAKFKREKKAAKTLGIVVGVFIMCWFPFFFILPLEALCTNCVIPEWLFKIIFWLGYCNSMMNPIIYAASSREFKRAFVRILKCQFRRRPRYFLDEESSTVTAQVYRFTNHKKRSQRKVQIAAKQNGSRYRSRSTRESKRIVGNESPIASLRLLHGQKYGKESEVVELHDDDSPAMIDSSSDDEKSDISNEIADDVLEELNRESLENGAHVEAVASISNNGTKTDSTNLDHEPCDYSSSDEEIELIHQVPNVIINNKPLMNCHSPDAMDKQCIHDRSNTGAYFQSNEDNIMWL